MNSDEEELHLFYYLNIKFLINRSEDSSIISDSFILWYLYMFITRLFQNFSFLCCISILYYFFWWICKTYKSLSHLILLLDWNIIVWNTIIVLLTFLFFEVLIFNIYKYIYSWQRNSFPIDQKCSVYIGGKRFLILN